jgi:hypothetical protein
VIASTTPKPDFTRKGWNFLNYAQILKRYKTHNCTLLTAIHLVNDDVI